MDKISFKIRINNEYINWNKATINYGEVTHVAFPYTKGKFVVSFNRTVNPQWGTLTHESTEEVEVTNYSNFNVVQA